MTARFSTSDGLSLVYDDRGAGHPLLCLAGLTRNMADFEPVMEHFADRVRVIRLDARGRGLSDHDPDWRGYAIPREAQDVLDLMDHLGLERASILGTSRGGLLALTLAASHPERLGGAVLVDIGPVIEAAGLDPIVEYIGTAPRWKTYAEAAAALPAAMAPRFVNVPAETWLRHAERVWQEGPEGLSLRYDPRLRDAVLEGAQDGALPDLWPLFDALAGKPLALIRGANSDLLSRETAAEMRRRRPDMIFADVPDRGHVPFLDEPEAVSAITAYLERTTGETA
jgi:pimeloyl-ACP methyl ester carboxylesterase